MDEVKDTNLSDNERGLRLQKENLLVESRPDQESLLIVGYSEHVLENFKANTFSKIFQYLTQTYDTQSQEMTLHRPSSRQKSGNTQLFRTKECY